MSSARLQGRTNGHWHVADGELRSGSTKVAAAVVHGALILAVIAVLVLIAARPAQGQTETVLYNFCSQPNCSDGANPQSRLTPDGAGNFYGTTLKGGAYGAGTVFELSPNGSGGWTETVLHSFSGGADGANPLYSYVIFDSVGNLYGTASSGGAYGFGVVFELSPAGTSWTETVLYSFTGYTGNYEQETPTNGLIMDAEGNLYGTAWCCVFELSPSGGGWTEQAIYGNVWGNNGALAMDSGGNIFGIEHLDLNGTSAVFGLTPNGSGGWNDTTIHKFAHGNDPDGTPISVESEGYEILYGTAKFGGGKKQGQVYRLVYGFKLLYSFKGGTDGSNPFGGLVAGPMNGLNGALYGTTLAGGDYSQGTVFEIDGVHKDTVLWSFNGTDGAQPYGSLILDGAGNLYGTTSAGGANGSGVVFEVTP
jgi:uncharacterized repeat protein (TIGR03803 family)